jgi:glycosyltransferase involved in cell wall biosynthesis
MARVVLYKGQSNYGALRIHIDQLANAFRILGHEVHVIDLLSENAMQQLSRVFQSRCDLVFSFNGMGIDLSVNEQSLYDVADVPFIAALVDHPHYHIERLRTKMSKLIVTCLDRSHLSFLSSYFEPDHFNQTAFLLPGGNMAPKMVETKIEKFLEKRTIPVLFTGSFRGVPVRQWAEFPKAVASILDDIAEYTLAHDYMPLEEALTYVLQQRNITPGKQVERKLGEVMHLVNFYVHSIRRYACLEILAQAGIPVQIYGQGWDEFMPKWKSFTFHDEGTVKDTLNILHQTQICLNTNTHFVDGGHERVFNAMINGAVVMTDESKYYNEEFIDEKDILMYKWTKLDELPEKIMHFLEQPEKLWEIAREAKKKAEKRHTWIERARRILELAETTDFLSRIGR